MNFLFLCYIERNVNQCILNLSISPTFSCYTVRRERERKRFLSLSLIKNKNKTTIRFFGLLQQTSSKTETNHIHSNQPYTECTITALVHGGKHSRFTITAPRYVTVKVGCYGGCYGRCYRWKPNMDDIHLIRGKCNINIVTAFFKCVLMTVLVRNVPFIVIIFIRWLYMMFSWSTACGVLKELLIVLIWGLWGTMIGVYSV